MGTRFQKTKLTYANCNQDICDLSKAVAAGEGTCGSGGGGWGSWGLFLVFSFLTQMVVTWVVWIFFNPQRYSYDIYTFLDVYYMSIKS